MAEIKHQHHVVPQFYLKRFANEVKEARQIDKTTSASKLVPVRRATVIQDLYLVDGKDGDEHDILENYLDQGIESNAARAFTQIIDQRRWPLDDQPRSALAKWVAAQFLRTPRSRSLLDLEMNKLRAQLGTLDLKTVRSLVGSAIYSDAEIRAKWQQMLDYYTANGAQPRNAHAQWFLGLLQDAAKSVFSRPCHLMHFATPMLLTSDSPVVPLNDDGTFEATLNVTGAAGILVPIGRRDLLWFQPTQKRVNSANDGRAMPTAEFAEMANRLVAGYAERMVFEHPDDQLFENLPMLSSDEASLT